MRFPAGGDRRAGVLAAGAIAVLLAGCDLATGPGDERVSPFVVSDPVATPAAITRLSSFQAPGSAPVAYVSLVPGSVPGGTSASLFNPATHAVATTASAAVDAVVVVVLVAVVAFFTRSAEAITAKAVGAVGLAQAVVSVGVGASSPVVTLFRGTLARFTVFAFTVVVAIAVAVILTGDGNALRLVPIRWRECQLIGRERDLVIDLEGSVVKVARSEGAPDAVDDHDLLMQERFLVLEEADPSVEERSVIMVGGVLYERHALRVYTWSRRRLEGAASTRL